MKILAIDTSTEACSAALLIDDVVTQRYQVAPRQHAELLLGMCEELLSEKNIKLSELNAIAFDRGPGAFTGVRIATGVTQGIAFAHNLPVVPVSSLAAMAFSAWHKDSADAVMTAIDARMDEVYWACYRCSDAGVKKIIDEQVCLPENIIVPDTGQWQGVGSGWGTYRAELTQLTKQQLTEVDSECFPQAQYVAKLAAIEVLNGRTFAASEAMPVYLRDNVAKKKAEQKAS